MAASDVKKKAKVYKKNKTGTSRFTFYFTVAEKKPSDNFCKNFCSWLIFSSCHAARAASLLIVHVAFSL